MKVMVELLTKPDIGPTTTTAADASHAAAEYWAKRTMWLLVIVTSLWDIAVTFDRHFALSGRLLSGRLL